MRHNGLRLIGLDLFLSSLVAARAASGSREKGQDPNHRRWACLLPESHQLLYRLSELSYSSRSRGSPDACNGTDLRSAGRKKSSFLVNFMHDELVLEVREDLVDEVSRLILDEMIGAFLELFKPYNPESVAQGLIEVGVAYNYAQVKC
jgi:hypothetical protein